MGRADKWSRGKTGLPQARGMKNRYESPRRCSPAFGRLPTRRGDSYRFVIPSQGGRPVWPARLGDRDPIQAFTAHDCTKLETVKDVISYSW